MGVPSYFRELCNNHRILTENVNNIKSLYIDGNGLIHPQTIKELFVNMSDNPNELFKCMFNNIIDYINHIVKIVNPSELVYIAVDGVAPLAKINQQRIRRFGYINNYKSKIYKKHNIPFNESWSNISITPSTDFMFKLHNEIKKYYENTKKSYNVIYDSYLTHGEGEHKLMHHIKNNSNNISNHVSHNSHESIVIYGLDADLIFLSMASNVNNIYLMRESNQFTSNGDENTFIYVDIDIAKQSINDDFRNMYIHNMTETTTVSDIFGYGENINDESPSYNSHDDKLLLDINEVNNIDFIDDYIFICYFLGNDFLPHLPSIDIKIKGYSLLLSTYFDVFMMLGNKLIIRKDNNISINNTFLIEFIKRLSHNEESFFKYDLPESLKKHRNRRCYESEPHKKDIWIVENLMNVKANDPIKLGIGTPSQWKYRYYNHYFKTSEHMNETIDEACHNYFEGLLWVLNYYFNTNNMSWKWQYRYHQAPFLSDLYNYIKNKDIMKDFNIPYSDPINIYSQLLSVIPAKFSDNLPNEIKHLSTSINSPIIDMFPTEFELDMINKTQLYKCNPIIPYLDISRIDHEISKINFSKKSLDKCKKEKPFIFNYVSHNSHK
jgi:5'-3' exonuclease